jgi:YHS domain-containing protein
MTLRILSILFVLVSSLAWGGATADSRGPVSQSFFGVAIGSMDTVAYHDPAAIAEHRASEGEKTWTHEWRGAKWRFASRENYEQFKADPDRYRPAYGGHCANALSLGEGLVKTDGTHWEIFGDRLFLFYAARGRDRWTGGDWAAYHQEADRAWLEITGQQD